MDKRLTSAERFAPYVFMALALTAWELLPPALGVKIYVFPRLSVVIQEAVEVRKMILDNTLLTTTEALAGLAIGIVAGTIIGVSMSLSKWLRRALLPYIIGSNSIPVVAISPLVVAQVGYGFASKAIIAAFLCFFPLAVGVYRGLSEHPPIYEDLFRAFGARDSEFFWRFRLRYSLPFVLSGLKVSATYAVVGAVVAEFIGSTQGVGFGLLQASYNLNTPRLMAYIVVAVVMGAAFYGIVSLGEILERRHRTTAVSHE